MTERSRVHVSIALFRSLRLTVDGKPFRLALRPKAGQLLAYLLLHRKTPILRDALAFTLWPDEPEEAARSNLRRHLYILREALPSPDEPWLVTDGDSVQWNSAVDAGLDIVEFERLSELRDPRAVELYTGDLLEQWYEDWIVAHRDRLRSLFLETLWALATKAWERRDPVVAAGLLERMLASDPTREDATRALMTIRYEQGDKGGALAIFDSFERRLENELGATPTPETVALRDKVFQDIPLPQKPVPHNLPQWSSSFVGRDEDVAHLAELLRSNRLVTVVGAGGVGKTRTAVHVAAQLLSSFPDGVWFVDLAPIGDAARVAEAVATSVGAHDFGGRPLLETLQTHLSKRRTLLLLDNCEHVVADVAPLTEVLLRACPEASFLATSRETLSISEEIAYRLPSLSVPLPDEDMTPESTDRYGATRLFTDRAKSADRTFQVSAESAPLIGEICRRLDGIPLALELAAARTSSVGIPLMVRRLSERFNLLTDGSRTRLSRHRTLRALIDWTFDLLTEPERRFFRHLAIFAGGWTFESAQAVVEGEDTLELHASLVQKSLVVADLSGNRLRYRLLESTRAYALEKLRASGEDEIMARHHAIWMADFADRAYDAQWRSPVVEWFEDVKPELENARSAIAWSLTSEPGAELAGRIIGKLIALWPVYGLVTEGRRLVESALAALGPGALPHVEARLWGALGTFFVGRRRVEVAEHAVALYRNVGDPAGLGQAYYDLATGLREVRRLVEADRACERALECYRQAGQQVSRRYAHALDLLASVRKESSRLDDARDLLVEILEMSPALRDVSVEADAGITLADLEFVAGHPEAALEIVTRTLRLLKETQQPSLGSRTHFERLGATALLNAAAYHFALGQLEEAHSAARDALVFFVRDGTPSHVCWALQALAAVAASRRDPSRAARLLGYVDEWRRREGCELEALEKNVYDSAVALLREQLTERAMRTLEQIGAQLSQDQAVAEALREPI